jgi:hypothetical protein
LVICGGKGIFFGGLWPPKMPVALVVSVGSLAVRLLPL